MGWEPRPGGVYYYRSKRVGGRPVREYIGTGLVAELAALLDAQEREEREAAAAAWQAERERLEALDAPVAELCAATDALATAVLLLAGCYQHKRELRRRRDARTGP